MSNEIQVACAAGVMTITIDRPARRNALTSGMYDAMADALNAAEADPAVRAILIRGHADVFTAGNDIEDFLKSPPTGDASPVIRFLHAIADAGKPLVAAVAGAAIGVGTTMLLHCDFVYAADRASFAVPFTQLGLCPEAASSLLLPRVAGYHAAAEKLLLGESFDANEAHRMGFVTRVLPAAELDAYVAAQLQKLVALPAASLRVTKALMKRASAHEIRTQMDEETAHFARMLLAPEAHEAFSAFLAKRKPDFSAFR